MLSTVNCGIIYLTPTNLNSPRLLFEAGAIAKSLEGRAWTILRGSLSYADVQFPLAQFQHTLVQATARVR